MKKQKITKTIADQFRFAYRLVKNPKTWTRGTLGRTENGGEVSARHKDAVAWCAVGACQKSGMPGFLRNALYREASSRRPYPANDSQWNLISVNDNMGQDEVRSVFKAVAKDYGIKLTAPKKAA